MPPKHLTDLAPELIIQILKSSNDFADLTSLGSASRKLFVILNANYDAIFEAVLPRAVSVRQFFVLFAPLYSMLLPTHCSLLKFLSQKMSFTQIFFPAIVVIVNADSEGFEVVITC